MKDNDSAFPSGIFDSQKLRQYAAIHLKVPRSGDPEIDKMIRESRRMDFAGQAVANLLIMGTASWETDVGGAVKMAFRTADALLAEWEKEAK
jgi:hypothetical protein